MATLKEYLVSSGTSGPVPEAELDAALGRYEWFTVARAVKALQQGGGFAAEERLRITLADRVSEVVPVTVDRERLTALSSDDIIDDFLRAGDYRIVADESAAEDSVKTEADFDEEDDVVTEELAEIYRRQGLNDEACAIYRKLSLRNPEKSVYFAELIDEITSEEKNR